MDTESKCPMMGRASNNAISWSMTNRDWWPEQLNLKMLYQNPAAASPYSDDFSYADAFKSLDLAALKADIIALMTD
ncbi:MAG: catalase-peroxidase, partial [Henriciella sp.]